MLIITTDKSSNKFGVGFRQNISEFCIFRFEENLKISLSLICVYEQRRLLSDWLILHMRISVHFFEAIGEEALFQLEGVKFFGLTSC